MYLIWANMKQRCSNPNNKDYCRYGAKGIGVYTAWLKYANFEADILSIIGPRPIGHTLDRIDSTGDYIPTNVRWATPYQQAQNTSRNTPITFRGETKNLREWARTVGITHIALRNRLKSGWSIEQTLTTPRTDSGRPNNWKAS